MYIKFFIGGPDFPKDPYFAAAPRYLCSDYGKIPVLLNEDCQNAAVFLHATYESVPNRRKWPIGCILKTTAQNKKEVFQNYPPGGKGLRPRDAQQICFSKGTS